MAKVEHEPIALGQFVVVEQAAEGIVTVRVGTRLVEHQSNISVPQCVERSFQPTKVTLCIMVKVLRAAGAMDDLTMQAQLADNVVSAISIMPVAIQNATRRNRPADSNRAVTIINPLNVQNPPDDAKHA